MGDGESSGRRNLVVLFDGTTNTDLPRAHDSWTNIVKIRDFINLKTTTGLEQKWWYCSGVGSTDGRSINGKSGHSEDYFRTSDDLLKKAEGERDTAAVHEGVGDKHDLGEDGIIDEIKGMAFGRGTLTRVRHAYEWLIREYQPGDQIFVFGFSRGGFAARCLNGMLRYCGIVNVTDERVKAVAAKIRGGAVSCWKSFKRGIYCTHVPKPRTGTALAAAKFAKIASLVYTTACRSGNGPDDHISLEYEVVAGCGGKTKTEPVKTFVTLGDSDEHVARIRAGLVRSAGILGQVPYQLQGDEGSAKHCCGAPRCNADTTAVEPGTAKAPQVLSPRVFRELFAHSGRTGEDCVDPKTEPGAAGGAGAMPSAGVPFGPALAVMGATSTITNVPYVRFLGVFDTVPHVRRCDLEWFSVMLGEHNIKAMHAVSLDETRTNFQLLLWQPRTHFSDAQKKLGFEDSTVWFPGNHGDVGGGWKPTDTDGFPGGVPKKAVVEVNVLKLADGVTSPNGPFEALTEGGEAVTVQLPAAQALQELCGTWMMHHAELAGLVFSDSVAYSVAHGLVAKTPTRWRARLFDFFFESVPRVLTKASSCTCCGACCCRRSTEAVADAEVIPEAPKTAPGDPKKALAKKPGAWRDAYWRYDSESLRRLAEHGVVHDAYGLVMGLFTSDVYSVREVDSQLGVVHESVAFRIKHRPARYAPANPTSPAVRVIPAMRCGELGELLKEKEKYPFALGKNNTPTGWNASPTASAGALKEVQTTGPSHAGSESVQAAVVDMEGHPEVFGIYDPWAWMVRTHRASVPFKGAGRSSSFGEWYHGRSTIAY